MTPVDAFETWWSTRQPGLPWEVDKSSAMDAFIAGFDAGVAQLAEQAVCSGQVAGSTPAASSTVHKGFFVDEPEVTPEQIYAAYPRKVGKQAAIKAIQKAIKQSNPKELLQRTMFFATCVERWPADERQYCPHPATWFNRGSYDDDPNEWVRGQSATTSQFRVHH